jgi:hypothetical protein
LPIESYFSGLSSVAKMTTALMQKKKDIVIKNMQESQKGGFRPIVPRPVQPLVQLVPQLVQQLVPKLVQQLVPKLVPQLVPQLVPTRYVSTYVPKVKLPANSYSRGSKFDKISEEIVMSLYNLESLVFKKSL